ncbi:hypothetical protein KFZ56_04170 [Virgibacillus sp. NKC19-3]|uniref:FIMAH domain-containing protein n=1 Tax=Virgibacillus saliphilus TaxID=2831674 RepID=UPI001C9B2F27|nr:hypothetical protein [Virgibacillus sp. NKC19-3]MBY7142301.1 hypothetical protein [Virgibacillus sp. NKC19-3]
MELENVTINEAPVYELLPPDGTQDMKKLVERMEKGGEISNSDVTRLLITHLSIVNHFEEKEASDKVVKHLRNLVILLDDQKENDFISERAYNILKADVEHLLEEWR